MEYDLSPAGQLEWRRAQLENQRENYARTARCSATYTTKGIGDTRLATPIAFNLVFLEEPCFTSGMSLDEGDDLVANHYPRVCAGVREWQLDNAGHYVGAYMFFTVDTIGPGQVTGTEPNYTIHHHLRWEGVAFKDFPAHLLDF